MSTRDFLETIETWISIYRSISMPDENSDNRPDEFTDKWYRGMLKVVGSLYIIDELKGTPVEKHLNKAIEDGKSNDTARLDGICVLLGEVERYMKERKTEQ